MSQNKFEQLIELFIAEDEAAAKDLFHEIVVEKSRDIYESLVDEDQVEETQVNEYYVKSAKDVLNTLPAFAYRSSDPKDEEPEDKMYTAAVGDRAEMLYNKLRKWLAAGNDFSPEEIEALDQAASGPEFIGLRGGAEDDQEVIDMLNSGLDTLEDIIGGKAESVEESDFDEAELGGDAADDMIDDIEADEEGLSMEDDEGDEEIEDRVVDLEDALDELKAEFEALMGKDDADDDMDMDDEMGDEEEGEEEDEMEESMVREYTEKAPAPVTSEEGDGSGGPVAGKNDMGGSAKNIAQGGEEKGGATPKSTTQTDAHDTRGATMSKA